ncbi:MAG: hypothetical protein RR324_06565 [Cellulosilyticaceae bacterium]
MSKHKTGEAQFQSKIDNAKDAKNSKTGFKTSMSSGTYGAGDSHRRSSK